MGITTQQKTSSSKTSEIPGARAIFVCYVLLLFGAAFTRDFYIAPLVHSLPGPSGSFVEPLWKIAFWLAPTFLYVKYVLKEKPLVYLKLTTNVRQGLLWGVGLSVFLLVLFAATPVLKFGGIQLPHTFDDWLNGVILYDYAKIE